MERVDELIRQLETGNLHERMQAAQALGDHHDPRAIDALIQTLENRSVDWATRIEAARALGHTGDPRAIEPLIRTLENEQTQENNMDAHELAMVIAEALGAYHDSRVTDALVKALVGNRDISHVAAKSLVKLRDRRAVEPLIRILDDDKSLSFERQNAARVLGVLGDPRAVPALAKALRCDSELTVKYTLDALRPFILTHPDAVLQLPPEDRNLLGRIIQGEQLIEFTKRFCGSFR
jgi:HEAT repeat protein